MAPVKLLLCTVSHFSLCKFPKCRGMVPFSRLSLMRRYWSCRRFCRVLGMVPDKVFV